MNLTRIGKTALRIYTCHILVFTAGAIAGGVEVALILIAARQAGIF
jgi:hypothetical protein